MTLRVTASTCTFAASQPTGTLVTAPVANLTEFVPATASLNPRAITLVETPPVDLLVDQILLRSEKNPEVVHRLYKGPEVPLSAVMGAFSRDALKNATLTDLELAPDHGMELEFSYSNGTSALNATLLWDVQNQDLTEFTLLNAFPGAGRGFPPRDLFARGARGRTITASDAAALAGALTLR